MASVSLFVFFLFSHLVLLHSTEGGKGTHSNCLPFRCGKLGVIGFPFANTTNPSCGIFTVNCDVINPMIQLGRDGRSYDVKIISQSNATKDVKGQEHLKSNATIRVKDQVFQEHLNLSRCDLLSNLSLPNSTYISFEITSPNQTLFKCNRTLNFTSPRDFKSIGCNDYNIYYSHSNNTSHSFPSECSIIQLPKRVPPPYDDDLFTLLTADFNLEVHVSDDCISCYRRGGQCQQHKGKFNCDIAEKGNIKRKVLIALGIGYPVIIILLFAIWHYHKKKHASPDLLPRNTYSGSSSRSDLEAGSIYFEVPVFSYSELEEATNHFDLEKELGDGGFGTVYHGKLHDGREVAVKRLYEHNYRRVEQFMNEIKILKRLCHKNLVSLYGCTSRHSRELLLVYEYIPNGTVSDHIHGDRATPGSLIWPTRMSIAIETASALAYLHASDIIHRDLISSLPAVDIARDRHEINLANLAINKIEKCAFHGLIDPHLGFESDNEVRRMTISVAKLAFQCIQQDKEMRPSMDKVLEALKKIRSSEDAPEDPENVYDDGILNVQQPASPDCDEVGIVEE
ncbi:LEAF RUST 10 DISEASE-RESISTANCE LOCUS RECEPTOR-LIKE PROTEIN KINASE-like 1.1 [Fagus crenata]